VGDRSAGWWGEAPEWTKTLHKANGIPAKRYGLGRYAAEPRPLIRHTQERIGSTNRRSCIALGRGSAATRPCIHCFRTPRKTLRISGSVPEPRPTKLKQAPQNR
jgi:hypothetical protein